MQPPPGAASSSVSIIRSTKNGDIAVTTESAFTSNDDSVPKTGAGAIKTHTRNLSAHFNESAVVTDPKSHSISHDTSSISSLSVTSMPKKGIMKQRSSVGNNGIDNGGNASSNVAAVHYANHVVTNSTNLIKKRHRRNQSSSGSFSATLAHRRVNSLGSSVAVKQKNGAHTAKDQESQYQEHQRMNSEGLDILSAVADFSEEEVAAIAGSSDKTLSLQSLNARRPHTRMHSLIGGPIDLSSTKPTDENPSSKTLPFPNTGGRRHARDSSLLGSLDHTGTALLMSLLPQDNSNKNMKTSNHVKSASFSSDINSNLFGGSYGLSPIERSKEKNLVDQTKLEQIPPLATTAMNSSDTQPHHRSISSLGFNSAWLPKLLPIPSDQSLVQNLSGNHHRPKSSNLSKSFFANLEDSIDANIPGGSDFLRGLAAPSEVKQLPNLFRPPVNPNKPKVSIGIGGAIPLTSSSTFEKKLVPYSVAKSEPKKNRRPKSALKKPLAKRETEPKSKRVRRKCSVEGCPNRVVQGGVCIAHGAKRKVCSVEGCTKNVKAKGFCSAHGPARKKCEHEGCERVAVQGGRCISHGAKKKLCQVLVSSSFTSSNFV